MLFAAINAGIAGCCTGLAFGVPGTFYFSSIVICIIYHAHLVVALIYGLPFCQLSHCQQLSCFTPILFLALSPQTSYNCVHMILHLFVFFLFLDFAYNSQLSFAQVVFLYDSIVEVLKVLSLEMSCWHMMQLQSLIRTDIRN